MDRQPTNEQLQALTEDNSLPDGIYLTTPRWGYTERPVEVVDGEVSLVGGEHKFSQWWFFKVNNVIKPLPIEAN